MKTDGSISAIRKMKCGSHMDHGKCTDTWSEHATDCCKNGRQKQNHDNVYHNFQVTS